MVSFLDMFKTKKLEEPKKRDNETTTIRIQNTPLGSSGTEIYSGYFDEDYLATLTGTEKAKVFDKMRRGDSRIKMCLMAVKNPIRSADWSWHAEDNDENLKEHAEFLNHVFFTDVGIKRKKKFKKLLTEGLSCVDFGYSILERTHKTVLSHEKYGQYIGLKALGWRSPKTIEQWLFNKDGELEKIHQMAFGDLGDSVDMNADFLSIITLDQEGDNYEGMSLLRPCYGAWHRKQTYLKLMAIGIEKNAIPTPIVDVPPGKEDTKEFDKLIEALEIYTSHQSNYLTKPAGWDIDFKGNEFDPSKTIEAIRFENQEITFAFLANFLELGASSSSGSYALSSDLSDFFTNGILYIADQISEEIEEIGKELIKLNFGPQESYPKLKHAGIVDRIGEEFGKLMSNLGNSGFMTADDDLEQEIRKRMKLPAMREDDLGKRDQTPAQPKTNPKPKEKEEPDPDSENEVDDEEDEAELTDEAARIMLAETKAKKTIKRAQNEIKALTQDQLRKMGAGLIDRIINRYNELPQSKKFDAISGTEVRGEREFKQALREKMGEIARRSIDEARKEVPKAKNVKLSEFEDLPSDIKKFLIMQSTLMVETTKNDLKKIVYFQFGDSVVSTESAEIIKDDMGQAVETYVNGPSVVAAGSNVGARTVNQSRNAFFFSDDVLEEVESFTFTNPDPKAPICKDLAGKTFRKDDPEAKRLFPPLHHNCDSYIVPNLVGSKSNPKINKGGLKTRFVPTL